MNRLLHKFAIIILAIVFAIQTDTIAQNTPSNASHLLSVTKGVTAPFRLAVKLDGNIYVTDVSQNNVVKYSKSFNLLGSFNVGIKPAALAINSSDEVFIGDIENGIIYKLDATDNPTVFSSHVNATPSMVFDKNDFLYVVDSKLQQVTVLDSDGNFVRSIGSGLFIQPAAVAYDAENNRLFISEHGGIGPNIGGWFGGYPLTKIWIFDTDGNELGEIGSGGSDDGEFYRIQGVTTSRNGAVYVTDPYQGQISIFEEDGSYSAKFGEFGKLPGQLNIPMDVAFDSQGRTLVSSMNTGAIEVYYVNEINPSYAITAVKEVLCPGENTDIKIDLSGTAPWTFTYTRDGADPVTVTEFFDDPYIFNTATPGLFELISLHDANFNAVDYSNKLNVSQHPFPTSEITSSDVEICAGTTIDIIINLTGAAPWRINYTDGTTTRAISDIKISPYVLETSENGSYEVSYIRGGGGCVGTSMTGTAIVSVNTLQSEISSLDTVICEGETVDIPITFTGTAPWTFTYSIDDLVQTPVTTSSNPFILAGGAEGIYSITDLSDASNTSTCTTDSANIIVTPSPASVISVSDVSICKGESTDIQIALSGTAPWDLTYSVDGINPVTLTGIDASPYILAVQDNGIYEVSALADNLCLGNSFSGSTQVTVNPLPLSNLNIGKETFTIFNGATLDYEVKLTGTAPFAFTYTTGGTNPITVNTDSSSAIIGLSEANIYEIPVVSDANCTNATSAGYLDIWYDTSPTAIMSSCDTTICEGETAEIAIKLTGTAPWTFTYTQDGLEPTEINTSNSQYLLPLTETGLYEVSALSDAHKAGIYFSGKANITVSLLPVSDFTYSDNELEVSFINNSFNTESYLWDFGDSNTSTDLNPIHTYESSGSYDVTLSVSNSDCGESVIIKTVTVTTTSMKESGFENTIRVYPNPSDGKINLDFGDIFGTEFEIEIRNLAGQSVYLKKVEFNSSTEQIDLSNYSSGVYILNIISKDWVQTEKIILTK